MHSGVGASISPTVSRIMSSPAAARRAARSLSSQTSILASNTADAQAASGSENVGNSAPGGLMGFSAMLELHVATPELRTGRSAIQPRVAPTVEDIRE